MESSPLNERPLTRREFARRAAAGAALAGLPAWLRAASDRRFLAPPLAEFGYGDVTITAPMHEAQLENSLQVLMNLSEDSLLKPFRQMAGLAAPGEDLGGWYNYDPSYFVSQTESGLAPAATFGQWVSALARGYAISGDPALKAKVLRLNRLYAAAISDAFYDEGRFPAYTYDKLLLGLIDSRRYAQDDEAFRILERTTAAALPYLPRHAVDRELEWRPGRNQSFRWDESYTNPENLFLAYQRGAGPRYRDLAIRFLDDTTWFDPLARGENVLAGKHAYSYVNSLSSAMQAYLTLGSGKHLRAAINAFAMLQAESFATGGWGPDEKLEGPAGEKVYESLEKTHQSFETPCGAYAHFKITRYLLRVTRDSRYGDSMERVMYNTVLGALPMRPDGRAFYYADYHVDAAKAYSKHAWPCCSGTLPQVAADYRINAYFREPHAVYVNLYLPSQVAFRQQGARCTLTQSGDYPFDDAVSLRIGADRPVRVTLALRIPEWAGDARLTINGRAEPESPIPGRFAMIEREWRDGDRIDLELPRRLRLEPIDANHTDTVALLCGPLVLFAVRNGEDAPAATRRDLLAARQTAARSWSAGNGAGTLTLLPYVAIEAERYSTYLRVT
jgi:DUF1680 family protein